jgi:hypothetical protein
MKSPDNGPPHYPDETEAKIFVSGNNNKNGTLLTKPTERLQFKNGPVVHTILTAT